MRKAIVVSSAMMILLLCGAASRAQKTGGAAAAPSTSRQAETDEYTRYELLAPDTASFNIWYEVTATTAGAEVFLQSDSQRQRCEQ